MSYTHFVGIDIAARTATVSWRSLTTPPSPAWEIAQTEAAYAQLTQRLSDLAAPSAIHVVLEATGSYWLRLALHLYQQGFAVSVVNPLQSRRFAQYRLRRAKTDALDAQLLAELAQMPDLPCWSPPPRIADQLQQRLGLRQDFLHQHTQQRNQRHALLQQPLPDPAVLARLEAALAFLQQQIDALTAEINALLHGRHEWASAVRHLLTIPGVGPITAAWVLVATHAFARCQTPEQAVAFAGLAPHPRDSGSSLRGQRSVGRGGHKALRDCLFMAASSAERFNPRLKPFYDHLLARGKTRKVARCAVARKLLHQCWAVVTKDQDFDPLAP